MRRAASIVVGAVFSAAGISAHATGLATCDSGDPSTWKPQEELQAQLEGKGWKVRRIKVDGGCYEVYAIDDKGARVEAYFDPRDFAPVATEED